MYAMCIVSDEPLDEPPQCLVELLQNEGLDPDTFITVQHGEMLQVGAKGELMNSPKRLGV